MTAIRRNAVRALLCAFAAASLAVVGCNTVEGIGKDVEGAGKAIQGD